MIIFGVQPDPDARGELVGVADEPGVVIIVRGAGLSVGGARYPSFRASVAVPSSRTLPRRFETVAATPSGKIRRPEGSFW